MAFIRKYSLVAGPIGLTATQSLVGIQALDLSTLRCEFNVKCKLGKPSHADIHVYNASGSTQAFLGSTGVVGVALSAGYEDEGMSQLYVGEIRSGPTRMDGANYVTRLETTDKTLNLRDSQIQVPLAAGATVYSAIQRILAAMNANKKNAPIGEGNAKFATFLMPTLWPRGGLLTGYAYNAMNQVCKSAGLIWGIDQGQLLLVPQAGSTGGGNPIELSSSSGLVSSPGNDGKGILSWETLMLPGISLNKIVKLTSRSLNGHYKIIEAHYQGDTHGKPWNIRCKGTPV